MKKKLIFLILVLSLLLVFTACAASKDSSTPEMSITQGQRGSAAPDYDVADGKTEDMDTESINPEKVISTISLSLETNDFDKFSKDIQDIIEDNEGFIQYSNLWYGGYNRAYRRGEYVIRIPKENINKFKDRVEQAGNLTSESTNRQNVTTHYRDTESRLRVVETKEKRILELLESADVMSDIIELERELNNIIYEKEYLTSQLMDLDDRIDYATVNLNVEEVEKYSTTEDIGTGLGTRIKNAFKDSLYFFYNSLENLIITLIYSLPFLVILVVLILIARKVYIKIRK